MSQSQIPPSTLIEAILQAEKGLQPFSAIEASFPDFAAKYKTVNRIENPVTSTLRVGLASSTVDDVSEAGDISHYFMSLLDFCRIVNAILLLDQNNTTIVQINTDINSDTETAPISGSISGSATPASSIPTSRYRTFEYHTCADPGVCILPNTDRWPITQEAKNHVVSKVVGNKTEILNIFVNFNVLESNIQNLVAGEKAQRSVYNLFDPIFEALNDAMGSINQIGFHYEEPEATFYIVDRRVQVEKVDQLPTLNITGLKSTVSQFDFTTKLSPAISTLIAISAQNTGEDIGLEAEALMKWNLGLTDRIMTKRKQNITLPESTAADKETNKKKSRKQQIGRVNGIVRVLNEVWNNKNYDSADVKNAVVQYQAFAAYHIQTYKDTDSSTGPAGIIPFEVQIEMEGISGIKIGQAFRINEGIMPIRYYRSIGFIVTGVEHSITNNRWTTTLKAQTIVLETQEKEAPPAQLSTGVSFTETPIENEEEGDAGTYTPSPKGIISTYPGLDKLKAQIGQHESENSYSVANIGGTSIRSNVNVLDKSLGFILDKAKLKECLAWGKNKKGKTYCVTPNRERVFATGRYQIINNDKYGKGGTLKATMDSLKLTRSDLYSSAIQEKMGDHLLLTTPNLGSYLKGDNAGTFSDLEKAVNAIGYVWASSPVTILRRESGNIRVSTIEKGGGTDANYGGTGANPAKIRNGTNVARVANLVIDARIQHSGKIPQDFPTYYNLSRTKA